MNLTQFKNGFFDSPAVLRAVDKATRKVLAKYGAFVRQRARTSIKKSKSVSAPGSPPTSHTGLYRKLIFFAYDPTAKAVVIGPVLFRSNSVVPSLLENGGTITAGGRTKTYRPRPALRLAHEAEKPNLPQMWRDSMSKR